VQEEIAVYTRAVEPEVKFLAPAPVPTKGIGSGSNE